MFRKKAEKRNFDEKRKALMGKNFSVIKDQQIKF